jgi:hypothetical protein
MKHIVYLHGFASSPDSSKARYFQHRLEAAGHTVSVPDLEEGNFDGLTISRQLEVARRAAGEGKISLIGSSMGGYLAALYAARHAEVERVVLLAPAFAFARRWPLRLGPEVTEKWQKSGRLEVFHYGEGRNRAIGYQLLEDGLLYEDFPAVKQPCLIFHGALDDVVPASFSQEFAAGRTNVELHVLDAGHDLLNVLQVMGDRTEAFLQ